jgi:hypothetical protein
MEKKPIIMVSTLAVVLLVMGPLSNVVGYQSVKSTVNDSPLFQTRTQRATNQQQNSISSRFLGMNKENQYQFPMRNGQIERLKKAIKIIKNMDEKTFERFTEFCIQRVKQDLSLKEINPSDFVKIFTQLRINTTPIIDPSMTKNNQNVTSSDLYTICHWFPGCIPYMIATVVIGSLIFAVVFFIYYLTSMYI